MKISLKGAGTLHLTKPLPAELLNDCQCLTARYRVCDTSNHIVFLEITPSPEAYDEGKIRQSLLRLLPYVRTGDIFCCMTFRSDEHEVYPSIRWAFHFLDGYLFRDATGTGSCTMSSCISE